MMAPRYLEGVEVYLETSEGDPIPVFLDIDYQLGEKYAAVDDVKVHVYCGFKGGDLPTMFYIPEGWWKQEDLEMEAAKAVEEYHEGVSVVPLTFVSVGEDELDDYFTDEDFLIGAGNE